MTMRAVIKTQAGPGNLELRRVPVPAPGPGEVLVKVAAAGICGTDLHIQAWDGWAQRANMPLPRIMGHEFVGHVAATGAAVRTVKAGDLVAGETHIPCGGCRQCRTGIPHLCSQSRFFGFHTEGCLAEYTVLPEVCAVPVDKEIPLEVAAVLEPVGSTYRVAEAAVPAGASIVVFGCGGAGLFVVAWCKFLGAAQVIACDPSEHRLGLAGQLGADVRLNPDAADVVQEVLRLTQGIGADRFIDLSGHPQAIRDGYSLLRRGGRAILFGLPAEPVALDLANAVIFREVTTVGLNGRLMFETWIKVQALLRRGDVPVGAAITHRLPLGDFEEAFRLGRDRRAGKVILLP